MNYKKYILIICLVSFIVVFGICTFNYLTDIRGIFTRDYSKLRYIRINEHFVKMEYILNNPDKYDSFIWGSSRVASIDPNKIPVSGRYYNMTYGMGLPGEFLQDIYLMLAKGVKIKMLLVSIDDFSFRDEIKKGIHQDRAQELILYEKNKLKFYANYLFFIPEYDVLKKIFFEKPRFFHDIYNTGRNFYIRDEERIETNPDKHINDPRFITADAEKGNRINDTLNELKEIQDIAIKYDIKLIFFINPIYHKKYLANNLEEFNEFKQKLSTISSYYDFSGINSITTNNYYYYDTSHYRPVVGDMIIARIFGISGIAPEDFGVLVPKHN